MVPDVQKIAPPLETPRGQDWGGAWRKVAGEQREKLWGQALGSQAIADVCGEVLRTGPRPMPPATPCTPQIARGRKRAKARLQAGSDLRALAHDWPLFLRSSGQEDNKTMVVACGGRHDGHLLIHMWTVIREDAHPWRPAAQPMFIRSSCRSCDKISARSCSKALMSRPGLYLGLGALPGPCIVCAKKVGGGWNGRGLVLKYFAITWFLRGFAWLPRASLLTIGFHCSVPTLRQANPICIRVLQGVTYLHIQGTYQIFSQVN